MNDFSQSPQSEELNKQPKKAHHNAWIGATAIIIALVAIIVAGFSFEQYRSLKESNNNSQFTTNATSENLKNEVQQLQTRIEVTQQNVAQLMSSVGDNQHENALSQIAYLINLANLQLDISHNVTSSLQMLNLAQAKLESLDDPRFFALSKSISKDILALKDAPKLNIIKTISDIDALSDAITTSSLLPNQNDLKQAQSNSESDTTKSDTNKNDKWYQRFWHHVSGVKDLIIIRHNDPKLTPLLNAEQQSLIKSIIRSKLLLAEYAAIQHNQSLYQHHLNVVDKLIKTYYFDSIDRHHLLAQVETLQMINVDPKLPDINQTITILNQSLDTLGSSRKDSEKKASVPHVTPKTSSESTGVAI